MEDDAGAARKRKRRAEGKPRPKATKGGSKAKLKGKAAAAAAAAAAAVEKVAEPGLVEEEEEDYVEGITEESIAQVMSWLELEIKLASSAAGGATPAPFAPPPPATAMAATGCGGYLQAAKGNTNNMEGSCGASFSVSASTVMASVDLRAGTPAPPPLPWPLPDHVGGATAAAAAAEAEEAVDDDEWVDQLLTDGPAME